MNGQRKMGKRNFEVRNIRAVRNCLVAAAELLGERGGPSVGLYVMLNQMVKREGPCQPASQPDPPGAPGIESSLLENSLTMAWQKWMVHTGKDQL